MNDLACIIDGSDEQVSKAKEVLTPVATPYFEAHKMEDDSVCFLYTKGDDLDERLASFIKIKPPFPCLVMISISSKQKWVFDGAELNSDAVTDFFERWQKNNLKATDL